MKTLSRIIAIWALLLPLAHSQNPPSTGDQISSMVRTGEVYQLETVAPLIDGPDRVKIIEFGPKSWVLVEYEASVLAPGELLPKPRRGQMWINFDQVVAARKVTAEPGPSPALESKTGPPAKR